MKKYFVGLVCGLVIVLTSVAFTSDSIKALIFPSASEADGNEVVVNKDLHNDSVNDKETDILPSAIYENTKHNFTLAMPLSWIGKYKVIDQEDSVSFIDIANNEAGWAGYLFTIRIWTKEKWQTDGLTAS